MKASELLESTAEPFDAACVKVRELELCLQLLIDLKDHKDKYGKDELYRIEQPIVWARARKAIEA